MRRRLIITTSILVGACGGGGNGGVTTLNGAVVKGPVNGATVCAYALVDSGKGDNLGCTTTRSDGSYAFDLPYSGPVVVEATGGTYTDEASGVIGVALSSPLTTAGFVERGANTLVATPLTAMAFNQAVGSGSLSLTTFGSATQRVSAAFGLGSEVDIARTLPDVSPDSRNAYGTVLVGISKMLQGGASLATITATGDLATLSNAYQVCSAEPVVPSADLQVELQPDTLSVELQIDLRPDVPADGPATLIDVFGPTPAWRATLPQTGAVNQTSCLVTANTEANVRFSCLPTTEVAGIQIFAGGSAAGRSFEAQPNSNFLPTLAGDRVVFSGGALRVNSSATVYIDAGSGGTKLLNIRTNGSITINAGSVTINGGIGPACTLTPAGAIAEPVSGGAVSLNSGDVSLSNGSLAVGSGDISLAAGSISSGGSEILLSDGATSLSGGALSVSGSN